jgi:hypothetical protein
MIRDKTWMREVAETAAIDDVKSVTLSQGEIETLLALIQDLNVRERLGQTILTGRSWIRV